MIAHFTQICNSFFLSFVGLSGKILSKNSLAPGFHFAGLGHIVEYPARMVQADYNQSKNKDRSITVATSDGKRVNVEVKVNYHVETTKVHDIYSKFGNVTGDSMEDGWLRTQTQNTLRDQYVKHSILDVLTGKAPTLESDVLKDLKDRFAKQGYIVDKADTDLYTAQKAAEANMKLAESITDELVKYKEAEAHMKHGWVTVNGTGSTIVDNK